MQRQEHPNIDAEENKTELDLTPYLNSRTKSDSAAMYPNDAQLFRPNRETACMTLSFGDALYNPKFEIAGAFCSID